MAKIQAERYFEKVRTKYGDKVEILSEYQGKERPIVICYHCEKHGDTVKTMVAKNVFDRAFNPCKECKKEKKSIATANAHKMSKEDLYNRLVEYCKSWGGKVIEKDMDDIIMSRNGIRIGKYINASTPVRVKCLEHDFEWDISLNQSTKG